MRCSNPITPPPELHSWSKEREMAIREASNPWEDPY